MTNETNQLDAFWMPFTANRQFKATPRMLKSASGMYYESEDGRRVLDGTSGLWCCNAGHGCEGITRAVSEQLETMDFAPTFQMGHQLPFQLAERLAQLAPDNLNHVFFTNSGSEAVDTALKIAIAWQQIRGQGQRQRLIGREKGYHGTNFGGISVGGIGSNKKSFGNGIAADHLKHTLLRQNAFSRGLPQHGVELLDQFEDMIALHGESTIAAVIVEPVAGSAGVIVPPEGYLKRLRDICTRHDILLIFDEVITAWGRLGAAFAAEEFGIIPDMLTTAKGLTNGTIPMGAVFVSDTIHDAFMQGPEHQIELFHGYTYSGHPVAAAAAMATLDIYEEENLFQRSRQLAPLFEDHVHRLANCKNVIDIRNYGMMAAVELSPRDGTPGKRAYDVFNKCFFEKDTLIRVTGDIIALSPPLIADASHMEDLFSRLGEAINETE